MAWRGRRDPQRSEDVHYHRVASQDHEDLIDEQFKDARVKVPWGAIILAVVLCVGGALLLSIGFLLLTDNMDQSYVDRTWPLITLGLLMFIPGVYHVRVMYFAFCRLPGYSFDDIPTFD